MKPRSDLRPIVVLVLLVMGPAAWAQATLPPDTLVRMEEDLLRKHLLTAPPRPLGVFCRLDVELDKRLPMPVRFRLGDARRVDRWEGYGPGDPKLEP